MNSTKKSVKQMLIELLKDRGEMELKDLAATISKARENVHPAHIRGVLNRDIKMGGKCFKRAARGKYGLVTEKDLAAIVEPKVVTPIVEPIVEQKTAE